MFTHSPHAASVTPRGSRSHRDISRLLLVLMVLIASATALGGGVPSTQLGAATSELPQAMAASHSELIRTSSVLAPLGLNPLLTLGALGMLGYMNLWQTPQGLALFAHPLAFGMCLLIGILLKFGRSFKLTKPFAEILGTGESLLGLLAAGISLAPALSTTGHTLSALIGLEGGPTVAQAGLGLELLLLTLGTLTLGALMVLRTALDFLTWISPFPFVDLIFQTVKASMTAFLIALAVLAPPVAAALNLLILTAAVILLRWAIRITLFGLEVVADHTLRRFRPRTALPRDPVMPNDLGPFDAFVLQSASSPKYARIVLNLEAGSWCYIRNRLYKGPLEVTLGDARKGTIRRTLRGLELLLDGNRVLLPPRYNHLADQLVLIGSMTLEESTRLLRPWSRRKALPPHP